MSFWSSVVSQAVDSILTGAQSGISSVQAEKMEAALLQILPIVNDALAIKDVSELGIGSCMIITILAARADLQEIVIQSLMEAVASTWGPSSADARIICLASLAKSGNVKKLSKSVSKKLLALEDLVERLEVISSAYQIEKLLLALIFRCIERFFKNGREKDLQLVEDVLKHDLLSQQNMSSVVKKLLSEAFSFINAGGEYSEHDTEAIRNGLAKIFTWLSTSKIAASFAQIAQRKKFDLSKLDAALHITVSAAIVQDEPEAEESSSEAVNEDSQAQIDIASLTLSDASRKDTSPLFLQHSNSSTFLELYEIFVKVAGSDNQVKEFLDHPVLRKKDMKSGDPTFVSFLLRIACSNHSLKVRLIALNSLTRTLENMGQGQTDYHVLTPYLIHLLGDPSRKIRQAGAQCIVEIRKGFHVTESHKTWAHESFYVDVEKNKFTLSSHDARILVSSVLFPNLEECILDKESVSKLLRTTLSKSSSSKGSISNSSTLGLNSATRTAIIEFLATHSTVTALLQVQITLLLFISSLGKSGIAVRSSIVLPATQKWVNQPLVVVEKVCLGQGTALNTVNEAFFTCITSRDQEGLEYLGQIVQNQKIRSDALFSSYSRLTEIWRDINQETRGKLLTQILRAALSTDETLQNFRDGANTTIRSISLLSEDLVYLIDHLPSATTMPEGPAAKRRRVSRTEAMKFERAPQDTMDILREYTLVLETVEISNPADSPQLLKGLFNVLRELQNFAIQTDSNLGYLKGLAVNSLLQIVDKLKVRKD
jgi:U3 small nucleolar RNA-associated protein 10